MKTIVEIIVLVVCILIGLGLGFILFPIDEDDDI